ncbi:pentatricopeptide repeat-containing protein At3g58590 [Salvia hispanica]|uniref:pentatricopeptide repeat-containing protein At3g58590 n=1 Tax=Salvia hispanica TaxID=49212 RepID=UPI0020096E4A|nr:pentatricopeptide repeat-containing protein At3g58590 [Salvia hispanica]
MRKIASFPKSNYLSTVKNNSNSHTQKLRFSASSNAQYIKHHSYIGLLHDPSRIATLNDAKRLHGLSITLGSFPTQEPVFLHNNLIARYAALGDFSMARKLFDEMPQRNVVSYNSMISCYVRQGLLLEAFGIFSQMRNRGFRPTEFTFGGLLSCRWMDVFEGMQLQGLIEKSGLLYIDAFAGTALLGMYARRGRLDEALGIFEFMPIKNSASWNTLISVLGQMGCVQDCILMFSEMRMSGIRVSESTFVTILSNLQEMDVDLGEQMHGLVVKHGFENVASVYNCLIHMYVKFGSSFSAEKVFETAPVKDVVSWNTIIGAMANGDEPTRALCIFQEMSATGLAPNDTTLVNVLQSCSRLRLLSRGECIHAEMIKKSFECDVVCGSALVSFYAKCDKVEEAHSCFDAITHKNLVSWNSLMLGYSNRGSSFTTKILRDMIHSGFYPNGTSFSIAIKSAMMRELPQLHSLAITMGYNDVAHVSSSLIHSYARNGLISDALRFAESGNGNTRLSVVPSNLIAWIYNRTGQYEKTQELYAKEENPDTVSWNILIAACSRNGDYAATFELFDQMRRISLVFPDNYTFVSLFSVCTRLCNLALGSSLHGLIVKADFSLCDTFVCNTMIDMYGKCGSIGGSVKIFNEMKGEKNVFSWTALVSALGLHGYANEALERFGEMEELGIKPDKVAFLAVLSACRHTGLVKEGMDLFEQMRVKYGVEPDIDHYLVVVDLLTRYGHIKDAERLILGMPIAPNAMIWRSFLEGCKRRSAAGELALAA